MNILLTGATGFFGSYLLKSLLDKGHSLYILKRSFSDTSKIRDYLNRTVVYNIDKTSLEEVFDENHFDVIVHTATNYGRSSLCFSEVIETNVLFPLKLLELLTKQEGKAFINTDSFFNRSDSLNYSYLGVYSMSKKQFLELASKYVMEMENQYTKLINMRLEHIYGPRDSHSKFVIDILLKLLRNMQIPLTPGEQLRDFIYVEDAAEAFSIVIDSLDKVFGAITNHQVGQGKSYSIKEFVLAAKRITNSNSQLLFGEIPYRNNEIMSSVANIESLKSLGWECRVNLEQGIQLLSEHIASTILKKAR